MDEETAERIVEKAEYVRDSIEILVRKQSLDRDAYLDDRETQDIVERRFETTIQACIDIAGLILKASGKPVPEVYTDRMGALVEIGVLDQSLGDRMASTAGFETSWPTSMEPTWTVRWCTRASRSWVGSIGISPPSETTSRSVTCYELPLDAGRDHPAERGRPISQMINAE